MVGNKEQLNISALGHAMDWDERQREADLFILESSAAIVVNDETGEIIRITKEAEFFLGYLENELIGQQLEVLIPETLRNKHVGLRQGQSGMPSTRQMAYGREVSAVMKSGQERKVTISLKSKYVLNKKTGEKERWSRAKMIFAPIEE
jgi:PAS domain S-box-containing protein